MWWEWAEGARRRGSTLVGRSREAACCWCWLWGLLGRSQLLVLDLLDTRSLPCHCPPMQAMPAHVCWVLPLARPARSAALIARERRLTVLHRRWLNSSLAARHLAATAGPCPVPSLFFAPQTCRTVAAGPPVRGEPAHAPAAAWLLELLHVAGRTHRRLAALRCARWEGEAEAADTRRCAACCMLRDRAVLASNGRTPCRLLARRTGQAGDPHARLADLRRLSGEDWPGKETGPLAQSAALGADTPSTVHSPQCGATRLLQCCSCAIARCLLGCLTPCPVSQELRARTLTRSYTPHPLQHDAGQAPRLCLPVPGGSWRELNRPAAAN